MTKSQYLIAKCLTSKIIRGAGTYSPWTHNRLACITLNMSLDSKTPVTVEFGMRVRALRKARGLSQEAFADLVGLDRSYIGGVERGDRNISLNNIHKIALALNLKLEDLFKEINE